MRSRRRRRDSTGWYPAAEAAWAITAILAVFIAPGVLLDPLAPLAVAVIAPAPFFLTIRIIAEIADLKAGRP